MKKHCVDLEKTGQFSPFFLDYLSGKEALKPFYSHPPREEGFDSAIQQKKILCSAKTGALRGLATSIPGGITRTSRFRKPQGFEF